MALGLGHKYWVRLVKHFNGNLNDCITFMLSNVPEDHHYWYELRPIVKVVKNQLTICEDEYSCDLVCDADKK